MINLLRVIYEEIRKVNTNVHLEEAPKGVGYPYIVYQYQTETVDPNTDGVYVDVYIYDKSNHDTLKLEKLYWDIVTHFKDLTILNCDLIAQFKVTNSGIVPTDVGLRRRWVELYIKTNWRR